MPEFGLSALHMTSEDLTRESRYSLPPREYSYAFRLPPLGAGSDLGEIRHRVYRLAGEP